MKKLLADEKLRLEYIDNEFAGIKEKFGKKAGDRRRSTFASAPVVEEADLEAMVEREPITILLSEKGWVRAVRGHGLDAAAQTYKEGDNAGFILEAQTTDKILMFASNGRFYAVNADKLPRGRGHGEPLRLMIDLEGEDNIVSLYTYKDTDKYLIASNEGRGFIVKAADVLAQTRAGKQALTVETPEKAVACAPVHGDYAGVIGTSRKLLLFPLNEIPEMAKGRGVILQKYKDGELSDVTTFTLKDGLTCVNNGRQSTFTDLRDWKGARAQAGRLPPQGFPRSNKFRT